MQIFSFKGNTLFDTTSSKNALWGRRATSDGGTSDVETGDLTTSNSKISPLRGIGTINVVKNYL